ncbi:MAG: EVE domain-containing protein [Pseudomonadota bacterium]
MNYWLMKSEPDVYGIEHLKAEPKKTDHWDGIRNYQARNMMRDDMKKGDLAFFYHSSCPVPGIVGIMTIVREAYVDHTQFDPKEKYYDPKSSRDNPRWIMVDVKHKKSFKTVLTLTEIKQHKALANMRLVQKGNRLSIMSVTKKEWDYILGLV